MTDWISVEDRLPERGKEVVARDAHRETWCARHFAGTWFCTLEKNKSRIIDVREWRPMPRL